MLNIDFKQSRYFFKSFASIWNPILLDQFYNFGYHTLNIFN